jgi:diguanylate cyclase (GGDEF)-like protein
MPTNPSDARLRELQFLAKLDREERVDITVAVEDPDRLMILHLLRERYVNDLAALTHTSGEIPDLEDALRDRLMHDLDLLLKVEPVALRINHKGRLRLAELQQALQTGRDREPFGILLGQRHVGTDLAIAITSASEYAPLTLAYADANGFKVINDKINHAAGDEALKIYMTVVSMLTEAVGEAYRAGGDEVVVIMPNTTTDLALRTMRAAATQLHKEKIPGDLPLSLSCGIVTTVNPNRDAGELLKAADEEQQRAKARSRVAPPRPSVIAVEGKELEVMPWR